MLHRKMVAIHSGRRELVKLETPQAWILAREPRTTVCRGTEMPRFPFPRSPQTQLTSDPAR